MPTNKTRKQKKVLCYTGIGSKPGGVHTPQEFLKVVEKFAKSKDDCHHWKTGEYVCPEKGNLDQWIGWAGAVYKDSASCRKGAKMVQKDLKYAKARSRKIVKKGLAEIKSGKYYKEQRKLNAAMGLPESHTRKIVKQMEKIYKKMEKNNK
jgi:hypothetical protein